MANILSLGLDTHSTIQLEQAPNVRIEPSDYIIESAHLN